MQPISHLILIIMQPWSLDDKFNLQRFPNPGSWGEAMYDVKCNTNEVVSAFGSGNNYGIWFDR